MLKLDEYVRINQAAKYLGGCRNTLRNWEAAGKISALRGRTVQLRLRQPATERPRLGRRGRLPGWGVSGAVLGESKLDRLIDHFGMSA